MKQTYHDLTSHYNGYFNANEHFNTQIKSLRDGNQDDYEKILPLESYGYYDEVKTKNEGLNTTIEKARLSIQTHQEKSESKNYQANEDNSISNWSDDAFLLIGKAYYFQGQLDSAISCFRYVTANFEEAVDARSKDKIKKQKNNKKKKAKEKKQKDKLIEKELAGKDIRPSKKLITHESAYSESLVWLAKAYINNGQFIEAENVLTFVRGSQNFLKDYDKDVEAANAYLYFAQGSYSTGVAYLDSAIAKTKKQKHKSRLQFVAGQVYEELGQKAIAGDYYKQSMKGNPDFEMVFYAKLKLIQMNRQSPGGEKEALKLIAKMTKDNKNKEYYDQLYYEKAMIALENKDIDDAKKFLLKSAEVSLSNQKQKGISYGKLADIYYEEEDYPMAQAYYDSAVNLLDNTYFAYGVIENRSVVLNDLIDYLNTIAINDSLLILGEIPAKELEDMLYKQAVDIIDAEIKQEEKNKQAQLIASANTQTSKGGKNAWYFYSEASKNSGYKKFKQIWGDIALEDDWRRSEKGSEATVDGEDSFESTNDEYFARIDAKYQEMIEAIPSSDKEKKELRKEIIEAYYNGAVIYKVGLENFPKSAEMFVTLNSLYSENRYEPEALYQLYVLYTDMEQSAQAAKAKQTLLEKYPDNKFSKFFTNPESFQTKGLDDEATEFYEGAYAQYQGGEFDQVILKCEEAKEKYSQTTLMAKFDLLKAMCLGSKQLREPYVASLEYVVKNHANTEEQEKAEEILSYLNGTVEESAGTKLDKKVIEKIKNDNQIPKSNQTIDPNEENNSSDDGGLKFKFGSKEVQLGGNKQKQVLDPNEE